MTDNIIKFNVRGTMIETDRDKMLTIPYFKDLDNCKNDNEIIFIDFDPQAMHHLINFLMFNDYKILPEYLYFFNFLAIDINNTNIASKKYNKCYSCRSYFENYKYQRYCNTCKCAHINCTALIFDPEIYCDNHKIKIDNKNI